MPDSFIEKQCKKQKGNAISIWMILNFV